MKKILLLLFAPLLFLSSCLKDKSDTFDPVVQAATDDQAIQAYLAANPSITATKDTSGLYYQILSPGSGTHASPTSTVTLDYTDKLLNGNSVDSQDDFEAVVSNLIVGFQIGIPMIAPGGSILLIVPSRLGYGRYAAGSIPPNSVLVLTINLTSVVH